VSIDAAPGIQQFTLGVDYKHFQQAINLSGGGTTATPISYLNLSLAYAGDWRTDTRQFILSSSANFGPRGLVNDDTPFADKRYKGRPNYFYLRSDGTFTAKLPVGFVFTARLAGQYALEPLINNEDYSISGVNGVRGYLEAESLSDVGINGTLQLTSPQAKWHTFALGDGFIFYDAGRATFLDSLPGEPAHQVLRSFGAGLDLLPGSMVRRRAGKGCSNSRVREGAEASLGMGSATGMEASVLSWFAVALGLKSAIFTAAPCGVGKARTAMSR